MKKYLCIVMAAMVVLWAASGAFAVVYGASGYENYGYSESTAWEINSAAVLAKVRDDVNSGKNTIVEGGYFKLTKDIDLTSYTNWVPIGVGGTNSLNKDYHFFTGHFDGGGHTIKVNIAKIQLTTEDIPLFECYCALFGVITDSGSVKNLNVEGSVSFAARVHTARHFTGGIAAYLSGGTIENCKFDGSVSTSQLENSTSTIAYAGGIVGYAGRGGFYASYTKQSFAIIKNCKVGSKSATSINTKAYNSSTTNYAYAGGITAYFGDSASQSELSGNWVKADMYAGEYGATGGIFAGRNGLSGKVSNNTEVDPSEEDPDPDPEPEPTPGTASVTITKSSLASGTAGAAYSDTLTAQVTGGSYAVTWTASGLPSWLSLNSSTGALSGTPTSAGSYAFTVIALINTGTVITDSKSYTLTIAAASQPAYTLTITKESLASGQVGTAYSDTLSATLSGSAVSPVWSVSSGSLPTGLSLNTSTGAITGTPTASGSCTFTISASFLNFTDSKVYTITIATPQPTYTLTITKDSLASGTVGTAYSDTLTATLSGAAISPVWSVSSGSLPAGLSLNTSTGAITGTPTASGSYTFTISASFLDFSDSKTYTVTIASAQPAYTLTITNTSPVSVTYGVFYRETLTAEYMGNKVNAVWSATGLPSWLTLDSATGELRGIVDDWSATFTVKAVYGTLEAVKEFTLTDPEEGETGGTALVIENQSLASAETGKYYSETLTAYAEDSTPDLLWSAYEGDSQADFSEVPHSRTYGIWRPDNITWTLDYGSLPDGLSLNASTGEIIGTPTNAGDYTFIVTALYVSYKDIKASKQFTLSVAGSNNDDDTPEIPIIVEQPEFRNFSIMMEGQIGMNFYVYIPDDSYTPENCWMEFNVRGDTAHTPQPLDYTFTRTVNGVKLYGFRCYINAGQMADTITATLNYGNGQTITKDYSAKTYLDTALATPGFSQIIKDLMTAIKNFGHYVQPMLSKERGWVIGEKYLFMEAQTELTDDDINNAKQEVKSYAMSTSLKGTGIADVKFSLTMGSETTINFYIFPASGYSGSIAAYIDGSNQNNAIRDGTRYKVQISDISAKNLGDMHTIKIVADAESTVRISALSYANSILTSTLQQIGKVDIDTMRKAAAALYNYYKTARAYADSR